MLHHYNYIKTIFILNFMLR